MEKQEVKRFKSMQSIKRINEKDFEIVKTDITLLDQKIRGLIMGEISVISGLNGSGKSNFLLYEMIKFSMQGYKTMLFSGEMQDYVIKNTLIKMIAGRKNVVSSQDGSYYFMKDEKLADEISLWLDKKFALYNNECSMEAQDIIQAIEDIVNACNYKIIILDNLMTINLKKYDRDKYEAQSMFIKELANLSKKLKIHIIIVMHPRKVAGFLRKDDISGSADLSNAVDNVFIVHRNNMDFVKRSRETFGNMLEDIGAYNGDNVIEVCKNRSYGIQDLFVPLFFEKETKRMTEFRNSIDDDVIYKKKQNGWNM